MLSDEIREYARGNIVDEYDTGRGIMIEEWADKVAQLEQELEQVKEERDLYLATLGAQFEKGVQAGMERAAEIKPPLYPTAVTSYVCACDDMAKAIRQEIEQRSVADKEWRDEMIQDQGLPEE